MALSDSASAGGAERLDLKRCAIVVDDAQPPYVQHAVGELQCYLQEITGAPVPIEPAVAGKRDVVIGVGRAAFQHFAGQHEPAVLGDEGFIIRTQTADGARSLAAKYGERRVRAGGLAPLRRLLSSAESA
jgi:alpha-glucuronidase